MESIETKGGEGENMHEMVLTLSWQRSLSYRNQTIDLQSMDWFLHDRGLRY